MSKFFKFISSRSFSLSFGVESRVWIPALAFVLLLSAFESLRFGIGFPQLLIDQARNNDPLYLVISLTYVSAALYVCFVFVLTTLASTWACRLAYLAVFTFTMFTEYGYSKATGRFTTYVDFFSLFASTPDQRIDSVVAYFDPTALIPCLALVGLCVFTKKSAPRFRAVRSIVMLSLMSGFYLHLYYINQSIFDNRFVSNSFGSFCQTTTDYLMMNPFSRGSLRRETVEKPAAQTEKTPHKNIILVFDESVRGDHLSLNGYERDTTPFLRSLADRGQLRNWGIAVSGSTMTSPSFDAFIIGATPDVVAAKGFGDLGQMPTIFQYAKAMNYRTFMFDGQMKAYWGGIPDDVNYIDSYISMKELDSPARVEDWERGGNVTREDPNTNSLKQWEIDAKIARIVHGIFSASTGNFILIYKRGVHYPYEKNYPEQAAAWNPSYHFSHQFEIPPADQSQAVINSYDNALRYNLDDFFKNLAPDYSALPNKTTIIYTSDHGESLYANGKPGHGGTTREEATVPLFMLGLSDRTVDATFRASHANIFTTLLDLMEYPQELRRYTYAKSLFDGTGSNPSPRYYNPPVGGSRKFD